MVSQAFGWPQSELLALFNYKIDTHGSEMRTRYNWKYSAYQGISATPSLAVNGVEIQEPPFDAKSMLKLLTDVYNSQAKKFGRPAYVDQQTFLSAQ